MSTNTATSTDARAAQETALWQALAAAPGASAVELTRAASVPKSAVSKILGQWAGDGRIVRANNSDDRSGFRWRIADQHTDPETPSTATETTAQTAPTEPDPTGPADESVTAEPASSADAAAPVADAPAAVPQTTDAAPAAVDGDTQTSAGDGDSAEPAPAAEVFVHGVCPACGQRRKGQRRESKAGVLRGKVEDFLRENPTEEFTPGQIAKALGDKSAGAVYNACFALVGRFVAEYTCEGPNKFRLHPNQAKQQAQEAQAQQTQP